MQNNKTKSKLKRKHKSESCIFKIHDLFNFNMTYSDISIARIDIFTAHSFIDYFIDFLVFSMNWTLSNR